MRYFLILITLLFVGYSAQAQALPIDPETGKIVYQEVVDVPGASADELFHKANYWLNTYFPSIQNQVEMIDSVNHEVVCKRYFQVHIRPYNPMNITTTSKIQVKENKYRYTFTDVNLFLSTTDCGYICCEELFKCRGKVRPRTIEALPEKMKEIVTALKKHMKTEEDDW